MNEREVEAVARVTGDDVRKCVEVLANAPIGLSLFSWGTIASKLLAAADALDQARRKEG